MTSRWLWNVIGCVIVTSLSTSGMSHGEMPILSGVVTGVDSFGHRKPIAEAHVTLLGSASEFRQRTDDQGRFRFSGLAEGRYRLQANKAPYLSMEFGAFRAGEPGVPVVVSATATLTDLDIELPVAGVITGIVRTVDGRPLPDIPVIADGDQTLQGHSARSDASGIYRIHGLLPGNYYVSAAPISVAGSRQPAVFYPGTTYRAEAPTLNISTGTVRSGIDIVVPPPGTFRVRGRVLDPGGQPVQASVEISTDTEPFRQVISRAAGGFTIMGLTGGRYTLTAAAYLPVRANAASGLDALFDRRPLAWAEHTVIVSSNPEDITMRLSPPKTVSGRLSWDAPTLAPPLLPSLTLNRVDRPMPPLRADVTSDAFRVSGVMPGRYRLSVDSTGGWYIASLQGLETLSPDILLAPEEPSPDSLLLAVSRLRSSLSGSLLSAGGSPAVGYWVIAFSAEPRLRYAGSPFVARTRPDTHGGYLFKELPIGDYLVAVMRDTEADWSTPWFLEQLSQAAAKVSVTMGTAATLNMRISR